MPVSTIATSASTRSSIPLIFAAADFRAPIRLIPVGYAWARSSTFSSGTTMATERSARSWATWGALRDAEKPRTAWLNVRSVAKLSRVAWRFDVARASVPFLYSTIQRPVGSSGSTDAGYGTSVAGSAEAPGWTSVGADCSLGVRAGVGSTIGDGSALGARVRVGTASAEGLGAVWPAAGSPAATGAAMAARSRAAAKTIVT